MSEDDSDGYGHETGNGYGGGYSVDNEDV
jgi:hypothetical protein